MKKFLGRIGLFVLRFRVNGEIPPEANRCVMTAAPHTSNWDFAVTIATFWYVGIPLRFTVKDSWTKKPVIGHVVRALGGLAIDRSPKVPGEERKSMVDAMVDLFDKHERLAVVVTPEGTRSLRTEWKSGFYWVANKANVPICMGYVDFKHRFAGVEGPVHPTGSIEADFPKILAAYANKNPKHPEKFSLDQRYSDRPESNTSR